MLYAHCCFYARRLISSSFLNIIINICRVLLQSLDTKDSKARHFIAITFDPYVKGTKSNKIKIK